MGLIERIKYGKIVDEETLNTKKELIEKLEELKKEIESGGLKLKIDDYIAFPSANFSGLSSVIEKEKVLEKKFDLDGVYDKIDEFLGYVPEESFGSFSLRRRKRGDSNYVRLHTKRWWSHDSILPEKYKRALAHSYDIKISE